MRREIDHGPIVFGIGYSKTATTSLHQALKLLGYRSLHDHRKVKSSIDKAKNTNQRYLSSLSQYNAFMDTPIFRVYKDLDIQYPGSKFILTVRDLDSWTVSMKKHAERYKWPEDEYASHVQQHKIHLPQVTEYFAERLNDLLIFDIIGGEGWEKLCPFLGMDIPDTPFPNLNKADKRLTIARIIGKLT